nr:transcription elongation factor SPT6 homolog [Tanacetum cinerariifolium]
MAGNTIVSDKGTFVCVDEMEVKEEEREEPEREVIEPEDGDEDEEEDGFMGLIKDYKNQELEKNYDLDEDDYELLEDNGFRRSTVESKKFKRLKKAADMDDIVEDEQPKEEEDGDMGEYEDEMTDFIVDEEDMDEHGQPRRHRKVKKKIFRQTGGVSTMALQEFHDIFGDVDEFLMQRKIQLEQRSRHDETDEWKERDLEDEFEPIILSEKYMTKKDDRIREMDIPERMQISEKSTGPPPKIRVFLSRRESDLRSDRSKGHKKMDEYYHEDGDGIETVKVKAREAKELAKKHFKSRMIVHPRFQNITADEAMEMLSDKEPGESIIRPSSRGTSYLTLTLKIYKDVYAHKDIIEDGKENKGPGMLCLGKTLKIGEDVFEDLDEVMDRYVDPLVTHLKKMLEYRKFKEGGRAEVDESLRKEKMENPSRIVYSFGTSHEHPGTFILTYVRSSNLHHEYIGLYPKGFKFRKKMFEDIDRLVACFQKHTNDPQDAGPSIRSVPMRCPATGGSGGWGGSSRNDYRKEKKKKLLQHSFRHTTKDFKMNV